MLSHKLGLIVLVCALSSVPARAEVSVTATRHADVEVLAAYGAMAALSLEERREFYSRESRTMRQDLWTIHLQRFLAERRDLTSDERSVIYEALGMLSAGILERARSTDSTQAAEARASLDKLRERSRTVMRADVAKQALTELGPVQARPVTAVLRLRAQGWSDPCECSTSSDWCSWSRCTANELTRCRPQEGCGTLWDYTCDGLCG